MCIYIYYSILFVFATTITVVVELCSVPPDTVKKSHCRSELQRSRAWNRQFSPRHLSLSTRQADHDGGRLTTF